jgi:cystathionine beta-lyase
VVTALSELLGICTAPGDRVVIDPPVYAPFAGVIQKLGRVVEPVPLSRTEAGFAIDLAGVERAYRAGARVHILCSPHNPTGTVHSRDTLGTIADLAQRHGVWVISDEVHAPMTLPGAEHVPFASVSPAAAARGILLNSASKTWNLAGLKQRWWSPAATPLARW